MKKIIFALVTICLTSQSQAVNKLTNGAPFFAENDTSLPRNLLLFSFEGGPAVLDPEKQGVILVLKEMLKEGPSNQSLGEFKQELFDLASDIDFVAEPNVFEIIVRSPPEEQSKVLALLAKTLEMPRSSKADFARIHGKVLAGLRAKFEDMRSVLFYIGPRDLMNFAPQTRTGDTSPNSFAKITYEDFTESLPKVLNYQKLFLSYIGPEKLTVIKGKVETVFQDKLKKPYQKVIVQKQVAPSLEKSRYTVINKPGATDNQIAFLFPQLVRRDSSEWVNAKINMDILGGGLHGRLSRTLRTERGLTYTAMSWFSSTTLPFWMAWTFGGIEQTRSLLTDVPEVVGQYVKTKPTAAEIAESKARIINEYKTDTELPKDRLKEQGWFYANGFDPAYADVFIAELMKANVLGVNKFGSSLQSKVSSIYIVGDKEKILPILELNKVAKNEVRIIEMSEIK